MTDYTHKGFKVHYDVEPVEQGKSLYKANGSVNLKGNDPDTIQKFQTEGSSRDEVEEEIKKMINQYIEFEWKQFKDTQDSV